MKRLNVKKLPFVMTILSALYFIYVCTSEETAMNADSVGGDPGGKFLPFVMAIFMFLGFLFITIKERPDNTKMDTSDKKLFLFTLISSILYIVLSKLCGFVLITTVFLFMNMYMYTTIGEERNMKLATIGCSATLFITVFAYFIFRFVSKLLLKLGRRGVLPIFKSSTATAFAALLIVGLFTVLLSLTLCKKLSAKGYGKLANNGIITFATVLFLYIIFKQFFLVTLAPGFINY